MVSRLKTFWKASGREILRQRNHLNHQANMREDWEIFVRLRYSKLRYKVCCGAIAQVVGLQSHHRLLVISESFTVVAGL